jgi:poly(hydroxyalkanoate) granule-associated protein
MAKQATIEVEIEETNDAGVQSVVVDNVHKVFLVGLGAAAMAQDELVNLIEKFAEQGEQTEQKVRESLSEMRDNRKNQAEEAKQKAGDVNKKAEEEMKNRMEGALNRFNIPSRNEIKALDEKISTLSEKIDELNKETA